MRTPTRPAIHRSSALVRSLVALSFGLSGCATLGGTSHGEPLVPNRCETRTGPFVIYTNTPIATDSPAVRCLGALERDIARNLGIRAPEAEGAAVEIYILRDRETFAHFLRFYYPELPPRRAFFLAQADRSVVYAFNKERLEEDLRHEATHALLHAALGELPLWLDEGLAEYLETPETRLGFNAEHVDRLPVDLKGGWKPDLERLETLNTVREMSPRDYREAWAWVHFLLNGPQPAKAALLAYLADLRAFPEAMPLSARLAKIEHEPSAKMLEHFDRVRAQPSPPTGPLKPDSMVLFQNSNIDPAPRPMARKGFFSRFFSFFGAEEDK